MSCFGVLATPCSIHTVCLMWSVWIHKHGSWEPNPWSGVRAQRAAEAERGEPFPATLYPHCSRVSVLPKNLYKEKYSAHLCSFYLGMTFVLELVNAKSHTNMVPGNSCVCIFSTGACLTCGRYCILPSSSYKAYTWLRGLLVRSCRRASEMLIPLLVQELSKYSCGRKPFLTSPPSLEFLACLLLYGWFVGNEFPTGHWSYLWER